MPDVEIRINDEMKMLAEGFQSMMERLNESEREKCTAQAKVLETERLASMGTLATGLAHEINNPIAGIQMCVRRLQKSPKLDGRLAEYLLLISEATDHIKGVVQDWLGYAQQSDRKQEVFDLNNAISDAAKLAQPRMHRNSIDFRVILPDFPCLMYGIRSRLVQVLVNGIINSIDAVGRDGKIWVELRHEDGGYSITIEDDGGGSKDTATKAFEPLFTTKGNKGTGLGLYVSFRIIMAHRGSIELRERAEGKGAVLAINLPGKSEP